MPGPLLVPNGEMGSLGVGKETIFASLAVPTMWHAFEDWTASPKNLEVPRTGARARIGQTPPIAGGYEGSASLVTECDPDTLPQLIAYSMGTETGVSPNTVNTTLTGAVAISDVVVKLADIVGIVTGTKLTLVGGTPEVVTVTGPPTITGPQVSPFSTAIPGTVPVTAAANIHLISTAVTLAATGAYRRTVKLGTPLPTMTIEVNRIVDALDFLGCKVQGMDLTMDASKGLSGKFQFVYAYDQYNAAPTTPIFSSKNPYTFQDVRDVMMFNGLQIGQSGQTVCLGWTVAVANNLLTGYFSFTNGRYVVTFPEQQRKVTLNLTMGFETRDAYRLFWGAATANAPQNSVGTFPVSLVMYGQDLLDVANVVPFTLALSTPACFPATIGVPIKSNSIITQSLSLSCGESTPGAQDDLNAVMITGKATAY